MIRLVLLGPTFRFSRFLLFALLALPCFAQDVLAAGSSIYIQVTPKAGTINDVFRMSVVIEGGSRQTFPLLTGGDDFKLTLIGPRSEIQIINGQISTRISYEYELFPKREGDLETPGAEIDFNGQHYSAPPLKISVGPAPALHANGDRDAFLRQSVNKPSLYIGEQLINTLQLFHSGRVIQPQLQDLPFDDFWAQTLKENSSEQRIYNGTRYTVISITKALFPARTGRITIPVRSMTLKLPQRKKARSVLDALDPFSDSFFSGFMDTVELEDKVLRSNSIDIEVKPLPPAPDQPSLWDLPLPPVGRTSIETSLPSGDIKVGESKTLSVTVTSKGNISGLKTLPMQLESGIRSYPEAPETKTTVEGDALVTKKTFRVSLVAAAPGRYTIAPLTLSFFDPATSSWDTARSASFSFAVPGELSRQTVPDAKTAGAPSSSTQGDSLAPAPLNYSEPSAFERLTSRVSPAAAMFFLTAALLAAFLMWQFNQSQRKYAPYKAAMQKIAAASSLDSLATAFQSALCLKLGSQETALAESFKAQVRNGVLDPMAQIAALTLIDEFDALRFGPQPARAAADIEALKVKAISTLKQI